MTTQRMDGMTTEREKLTELLRDKFGARTGWAWPDVTDAIIAAGFRLVTPPQDVVEGAREVFGNLLSVDISHHQASFDVRVKDRAWDVQQIAAFAAAHAARERGAVFKFCEQIMGRLDEHDAAMFAPEFAALRARTP